MRFPSIEEYDVALQAHARSVLDPLLSAGIVETNSWGTPRARSGTFALTYKVSAGGREYAFRCFQRDRAGMHERYAAIHRALGEAPLPYFVDFAYLDPGIAVQGQRYPAIRMDWADGQPLGAFIEENLKQGGRLRALQQQLHGMALALEGAGIAHGDVQTNNILVGGSGDIKLVDYDGMYVPSLRQMGALEAGHRNFQHPQRERLNPYDATLDRFSFALLHATLSALIENPTTWAQLDADPEALLLRKQDFLDPSSSRAFAMLAQMPGSGPVFQRLQAVCRADYGQTPTFSDFLAGRGIPVERVVSGTSAPVGSGGFQPGTAGVPLGTGASDRYQSRSPVVDAADLEACAVAAGQEVELVGQVQAVGTGSSTPTGEVRDVVLTLGGADGLGAQALILAQAMRELAVNGVEPGADWVSRWVSVTGTMSSRPYPMGSPRPTIVVEHAPQVEQVSGLQARWRLATWQVSERKSGTAAPSQPGPPSPAATANQALLGSLNAPSSAATQASAAPTAPQAQGTAAPASSTASGGVALEVKVVLSLFAAVALLVVLIGFASSCSRQVASGGLDESISDLAVDASQPTSGPTASPTPTPGPAIQGIPVAYVTTCIRGKDVERQCWPGTTEWAYDYCWNLVDRNPSLQRYGSGSWKTVDSIGVGGSDGGAGCDAEFPSRVYVEREEEKIGAFAYRVNVPGSTPDAFTVTVTAPDEYFRTCVTPEDSPRYCTGGREWVNDTCWDGYQSTVLQGKSGGSWKEVRTVGKILNAKSSDCTTEYPWRIRVNRKESRPGTFTYRLYKIGGEFTTTTYEIGVEVSVVAP